MGSSPPKPAEAACSAVGLRSKLEKLARRNHRAGPLPDVENMSWGWLQWGMAGTAHSAPFIPAHP